MNHQEPASVRQRAHQGGEKVDAHGGGESERLQQNLPGARQDHEERVARLMGNPQDVRGRNVLAGVPEGSSGSERERVQCPDGEGGHAGPEVWRRVGGCRLLPRPRRSFSFQLHGFSESAIPCESFNSPNRWEPFIGRQTLVRNVASRLRAGPSGSPCGASSSSTPTRLSRRTTSSRKDHSDSSWRAWWVVNNGARYSFLGSRPREVWLLKGDSLSLWTPGNSWRRSTQPIRWTTCGRASPGPIPAPTRDSRVSGVEPWAISATTWCAASSAGRGAAG